MGEPPPAERGDSEKDGMFAGALFKSNQVAVFNYTERRAVFATRVMECINRTFDAQGAGATTQQLIFWKLSVTMNIGKEEIVDKPMDFLEGVKSIYGEAGVVVFEYLLRREIRREFRLPVLVGHSEERRTLADLLQLAASQNI